MASLIKGYISVLVGRVFSGYPVVIAKRAVASASSFPVIPKCAGIHSMWIVIPWFLAVFNCANIWFILSGLAVEVPDCRDWTELRESVKMAISGTCYL